MIMEELEQAIGLFGPISLEEMDRVALQSRMDTKFLFSASDLPALLQKLSTEYRILETAGRRGTLYHTLYFDTAGRRSYFDHHRGRTFRHKVRMREYVGSGTCFLEVKLRTGRGGTNKKRIPVPAIAPGFTPEQAAFVARAIGAESELQPVLTNDFLRYTLVHRTRWERLTLDTGLQFTAMDGRTAALPGLCVAELKEGRTGHGSPFLELMKALPSPPVNFSKYCMGTVLLWPRLKYNRFKPIVLRARKLAA